MHRSRTYSAMVHEHDLREAVCDALIIDSEREIGDRMRTKQLPSIVKIVTDSLAGRSELTSRDEIISRETGKNRRSAGRSMKFCAFTRLRWSGFASMRSQQALRAAVLWPLISPTTKSQETTRPQRLAGKVDGEARDSIADRCACSPRRSEER